MAASNSSGGALGQSCSPFYLGIQGVLKSWTALQLAVSHGFGGSDSSEKAQWLVGVIESYFTDNDDLEQWELEDFISQIMNQEFNTVLEDDSMQKIAEKLLVLYALWSKNRLNEMQAYLNTLPQVDLSECMEDGGKPEEDMVPSEGNNDVISALSSTTLETMPEEEEKTENVDDGWTMVTRSRRTNR